MMKHKSTLRYGLNLTLMASVICVGGLTVASAQEQKPAAKEKSAAPVRRGGRDPFKKYEVIVRPPRSATKLDAPPIQVRIERYRAQKLAAATAHVPQSLLKAHRQRVLTAEPPALVHRHLAEAFDAFGSVQRAAA